MPGAVRSTAWQRRIAARWSCEKPIDFRRGMDRYVTLSGQGRQRQGSADRSAQGRKREQVVRRSHTQFYVMTAKNAKPAPQFCAYHSAFDYGFGKRIVSFVYAYVPYVGYVNGCDVPFGISPNKDVDADGSILNLSHEQMEMVTDPAAQRVVRQCQRRDRRHLHPSVLVSRSTTSAETSTLARIRTSCRKITRKRAGRVNRICSPARVPVARRKRPKISSLLGSG